MEKKIKKNLVIGIGGISRSGKTSLANKLADRYKCPLIHNDHYFLGPIKEKNDTIIPGKTEFDHWESSVCCNVRDFYYGLLRLAYEPNEANMVISEGHLLYNRQDAANTIDVKIHLKMSKDGASARLKVLRPRLIRNDKWYDHIMWDQYLAQNDLFNAANPRSYEISGELPPDVVESEVIKIIEKHRLEHQKGELLDTLPKEISMFQEACTVCGLIESPDTDKAKMAWLHSCGHYFHHNCFRKIFKIYILAQLDKKETGALEKMKCPKCSKEIDENFIQIVGDLHDYKKTLFSTDICYKCKECDRLAWGCKGYQVVSFKCGKCKKVNFI